MTEGAGASRPVLVEGCVESVAGAIASERAGARRIELCANLAADGTSPGDAVVAAALARLSVPVVVMVRPRAGDFHYSSAELEAMEREVAAGRRAGAAGVALGTLAADGTIDAAVLRALVRAAGPLDVVFHRAFDATPDTAAALDVLLDAGVRRVLTSGGASTAREGLATIAALVRQAAGRITVMPGGRVDAAAARELVREAGVKEVHVGNDPERVRAVVAAVADPGRTVAPALRQTLP